MADFKKLSIFVERMVPSHVRDDHANFVLFLKKYFEFLEQDNSPYDVISKLLFDRNIDNSINSFIEDYRGTYAADLPEKNRADLLLVIKNVRDYYAQKGNEDSFKFLFRTIYDEPIEFYYPRVDILRCSDGKWYKPTHIVLKKPDNTYPDYIWLRDRFLSKSIIGLSSGDIGFVEGFTQVPSPAEDSLTPDPTLVWAAKVTGSVGSFLSGENVRLRDDPLSDQAVIDSPVLNGFPAIEVQEGRWIGTDGFLSSNKYLQDNYYYQEHSYQVRIAMSSNFYWRTIRKNVHPAGTIFFGVVDFLNGILSSMETASATYLQDYQEWLYAYEQLSYANQLVNAGTEKTTNLFQNSSNFSSGWTNRGISTITPDALSGAFPGWENMAQFDLGGGGEAVDDAYKSIAGVTEEGTYTLSFRLSPITTTGVLNVDFGAANTGNKGQWSIDLSQVTGIERLTADHPAVTVVTPLIGKTVGTNYLAFSSGDAVAKSFYISEIQVEAGSEVHSYSTTTTIIFEKEGQNITDIDIQTGGSASWSTYSFIERMRELEPYASLYNASAFDWLTIDTFYLQADAGYPFGRESEITIV